MFVTIHPFDDGNGRIARALTDMMLTRSERTSKRFYSMSAEIKLMRSEYYEVLERIQRGDGDITEWLLCSLDALMQLLIRRKKSFRLYLLGQGIGNILPKKKSTNGNVKSSICNLTVSSEN